MQHGHDVRGLRHRVNHVVGEHCRVGGGEAYTLQALNLTAGTQQLGECLAVTELHAVGVHVLTEQGHLNSAVIDQRLNLGEDVAGAAVLLLTAQGRHDAEGAGVVTANRDGHPAGVHVIALSGQGGGENFEGFEQFCLRLVVVAGALQQRRQGANVVSTEHDVNPGCLLNDGVLVLLRQTAAHSNLHALVSALDRRQLTEVAVQAVGSVFANRTGIENHQVGLGAFLSANVAVSLQQAGHSFGVVHVHLAAESAHFVGAGAGFGGLGGIAEGRSHAL